MRRSDAGWRWPRLDRRNSDQGLIAKFGNYYETLAKSLAVGVGRPRLTNYASIDEAIYTAVNDAASARQSPTNALAASSARVVQLLQQAGYNS